MNYLLLAEINVGFDQEIYRVSEDVGYIAPKLCLEKPLNCCINIRAALDLKNGLVDADGEFHIINNYAEYVPECEVRA